MWAMYSVVKDAVLLIITFLFSCIKTELKFLKKNKKESRSSMYLSKFLKEKNVRYCITLWV